VVIAVVVVLLVVAAAAGAVALVGRDDGTQSRSSVSTTARSDSSRTTASTAPVTTMIAPTTPASAASFTVHATCSGGDCAVAVRDAPTATGKSVRSLRANEVVQISCSTHGQSIQDPETGQRSDVWYRLAGTDGYSSAVYLEGPTVPDCG
jgi:hypothetical protein